MFKFKLFLALALFITSTTVGAESTKLFKDRFRVIIEDNAKVSLKTLTKPSDGLGQIIRELGLQPNWSKRTWVSGVHKANPDKIDKKGAIINSGSEIEIPLESLKDCSGFSKLKSEITSFKHIESKKHKALNPLNSLKSAQSNNSSYNNQPQLPVKTQEKIVKDTTSTEKQGRFNMIVWGGVGFSQNSNDDTPSTTTTELNTDLAFQFGANFGYLMESSLYTQIYIYGDHRKYKEPINLGLSQDTDLFLSYGLELGVVTEKLMLGIFAELAQTARSQLVTPNLINVSDENAIKFGLNVTLPFTITSEKDLNLTFRPYFINSFDLGNIEYDSGFGIYSGLNYQFKGTKLFTNVSLNYEQQNYDLADNSLIDIFVSLGFILF